MRRSSILAVGAVATATLVFAPGHASSGPAGACTSPRVTGITPLESAKPLAVTLRIGAQDDDGKIGSIDVDWGDGRLTHADVVPSRRTGEISKVRLSHRYKRRGRYLVAVTASAGPAPGCGDDIERSRTKRVRVRAK